MILSWHHNLYLNVSRIGKISRVVKPNDSGTSTHDTARESKWFTCLYGNVRQWALQTGGLLHLLQRAIASSTRRSKYTY